MAPKALYIQSYTDHPSKYYYTGLLKKVKKNEAKSGIYLGFYNKVQIKLCPYKC